MATSRALISWLLPPNDNNHPILLLLLYDTVVNDKDPTYDCCGIGAEANLHLLETMGLSLVECVQFLCAGLRSQIFQMHGLKREIHAT